MNAVKLSIVALAATPFIALSAPAFAETVKFSADLTGSAEAPPVDTKGSGKAEATLDTTKRTLSYTITYSGLSGPATAAHFHGPADPGKNAPPVVPIKGKLSSPIKGSTTLTANQMQDLQNGKWYFNVHTAQHKDGEIRGQLMKGM